MLQFCSRTNKHTYKSLDITDNKGSLKPADMKYQKIISKFHVAICNLHVNFDIQITKNDKYLQNQIKIGLDSTLSSIKNSLVTINESIRESSIPLTKFCNSESETLNVDIFTPFTQERNSTPKISLLNGIIKKISGYYQSRAFIYSKEMVQNVVEKIKIDLMRSITARVYLLFEETERIVDRKILPTNPFKDSHLSLLKSQEWIMPKRLFFPFAGVIHFCDYIFPSETLEVCKERCQALLNVSSEDVDLSDWFILPEQFSGNISKTENLSPVREQTGSISYYVNTFTNTFFKYFSS